MWLGTLPATCWAWDETATNNTVKGTKMSNANPVFAKACAALGAIAISATLFVTSFADPASTSVLTLVA